MNDSASYPPDDRQPGLQGAGRLANVALVVGVAGLALSAVSLWQGFQNEDSRPWLAWLLGGTFWLSLGLGTLFLVMIGYIFDAGWSVIIRRQMEHSLGVLKWLALIFAPLALVVAFASDNAAVPWLWMRPESLTSAGHPVSHDPLYLHKSGFLNVPFFLVRFGIYFAIWVGLAEILRHTSFAMDRDGDHQHFRRARVVSALGVILCALATTFAAIDWFKSLDYHWFSTMYGVWFFAASLRAGAASIIVICFLLATRGHLRGLYRESHSYLLGCMLLAFTVFWAYISFCQYFLIYNANIPEETYWFNIRQINPDYSPSSWFWVGQALIYISFLVPFLVLLFHKVKFGRIIVWIALWILAAHLLDLYWNILPAKTWDAATGHYTIRQFSPAWYDFTTLVGAGGLCLWAFLRSAVRAKPIPVRDPRILESIHYNV